MVETSILVCVCVLTLGNGGVHAFVLDEKSSIMSQHQDRSQHVLIDETSAIIDALMAESQSVGLDETSKICSYMMITKNTLIKLRIDGVS